MSHAPATPAAAEPSKDPEEQGALGVHDLGHATEGAGYAELACAPVNLVVHLGERRQQPFLELSLRERVGLGAPARVLEREHAVRHGADLRLDAPHAHGELLLVWLKLAGPPIEPVVHHLSGEPELLPRARLHAAQRAPDHLALVEHGGLDLGIGAGARQALAQGLERAPLQGIAPDRLGADKQHREHHQPEAKEEFLLERHVRRSTDGEAGMALNIGPGRGAGAGRVSRAAPRR